MKLGKYHWNEFKINMALDIKKINKTRLFSITEEIKICCVAVFFGIAFKVV